MTFLAFDFFTNNTGNYNINFNNLNNNGTSGTENTNRNETTGTSTGENESTLDGGFSDDDSGQGQNLNTGSSDDPGTVPLIIEINENKIIFNEKEISLTDLEQIILEYNKPDSIWELHDIHQATKTIYDEVTDLLKKHDIVFREY